MLIKRDLLWILAYPIYQIIGTFRHEGSHALAALIEGVGVEKFVFWPTFQSGSGIWWGYVTYSDTTSWFTSFAPYLVDLLTFLLFFWICMRVPFFNRSVWLNVVILGLISPLVNTFYNYLGRVNGSNDVARLLKLLPNPAVYTYFWLTIFLYTAGIWYVFRYSETGKYSQPSGRLSLDV